MEIFSTDIARDTFIEYLSLYLAPIPFLLLIYNMRKHERRWKDVILKGALIALSSFAAIATFLQCANIVHFPAMVVYFHIIGAICLLSVLIVCVSNVDRFSLADKILTVGLVVMCVSIAIDLVSFNIQKYVFPDNALLLNSVLPIGTLFFIVFMVISYLAYLYDMVMTRAEKDTLTKLAYRDALTGLYNRAKCEELFTMADKDGFEYAIINMDLNGLKKTNDTYGHAKGDLLLTSFADILQEAFFDIGTVVRMGGDEFLVLRRGTDTRKLLEGLKKMEQMEDEKTKELDFSWRHPMALLKVVR